jgi:hypothetical protein
MKYGILEDNKFLFIDDDREKLLNTLPFIGKSESDIQEFEDEEVELAYDNSYYIKGYTPVQPVDEYNAEQKEKRSQAYIERTDYLTLRKMRKQALGEWTDEDESQYISEIQAISQQINEEYPYKE